MSDARENDFSLSGDEGHGFVAASSSEEESGGDSEQNESEDEWFEDTEGQRVEEWKPFLHWYKVLQAYTRWAPGHGDEYPVRIGQEEEELWVYVDDIISSGPWRGMTQKHRYREVHEAILMMTLLARVDHARWIDALARHERFDISQHPHLLSPKFVFFSPLCRAPHELGWNQLQHLFGNGFQLSERFQRDYNQLCVMATTRLDEQAQDLMRAKLSKPIPMKLELWMDVTPPVEMQVFALQKILEVINGMRRSNSAPSQNQHFLPELSLDELELDVGRGNAHPKVYKALQTIVETGVHIKEIVLPVVSAAEEDIRLAWCSFITSTLGPQHSRNGAAAHVDELVLGDRYCSSRFSDAFCSALCKTRVLKSLKIDVAFLRAGTEREQRRFWGWLCFALFSKASNNSVHTIQFKRLQLGEERLTQLREMAAAPDPLGLLQKWMLQPRGKREAVRGSVSPAGTIRSDLPENQPLQTLVCSSIHNGREASLGLQITADAVIKVLLEVVGSSITSLALEAVDLTEASVAAALRLCPRLENLRLRGAALPSLEVLTSQYQANSAFKLSSLDLRDLRVPQESIAPFLELLGSRDPIVRKLHRLHIGDGWIPSLGWDTEQDMKQMLRKNQFLTHVMFCRLPNERFHEELETNGDVVVCGHEERLAFLGAVRMSSNALGLLPPALSAQIFDFAIPTTWRKARFGWA